MIALTLIALLLLGVMGAQHLLAPSTSRRLAHRRLRAAGRTIGAAAGAELEASLTRRTRAATTGGAVGVVVATAVLWLVLADPTGSPGLLPVAVVLTAAVLASVLAESAHVARTTPPVPDGVRVAGLRARDPHLSGREALAEAAFALVAVLALVLTVLAQVAGVEHALAAATCAAAAVLTVAVTGGTRWWLLQQPTPAGDGDRAVVAGLLTTASTDRFTENLIANGAVLLLYAAVVLAPGLPGLASLLLVALVVLAAAAMALASWERSRVRRAVPA